MRAMGMALVRPQWSDHRSVAHFRPRCEPVHPPPAGLSVAAITWSTVVRPYPHPSRKAAMRIALFATCIVDAMYPATAKATVKILERLGHEVVFPSGQACCGQMHVNSGYLKEAV